jgi:hypothetical protein
MRGVALGPALLLLAALLAGCSSGPTGPAEVLVQSQPTDQEVHSSNGTGLDAAVAPPPPKTRGHIAGVVVDEGIHPLPGVKVRLPGMALERTTDRDGSFGFVDLYPGPYYLQVNATGYYPAEAVLQVKEGEFTRAKVVLKAIPPPEPYHVTQKFDGFADVTEDDLAPFDFGLLCGTCSFSFYVERPDLKDVVLEAATQSGGSQEGFTHRLYDYNECCTYFSSGSAANPMRVELKSDDLGKGDRFQLDVNPTSFPAPETQKSFQVFVTAFYNQPAPTGWSFVAGDP